MAEEIFFADGVISSITTYPDTGHAESLHYHETLHVSYVLKGGNVEKRTTHDIERLPGIVTWYEAGELHRSTKTLAASKHINLEVEQAFLQQYAIDVKPAGEAFLKSPDAAFIMLKILKELQVKDAFTKHSIHLLAINLLTTGRKQNNYAAMPQWLHTIYTLLHDRWNENVTLRDLALAANVHPVTVSKYFPRYFGCTMGEYMRKIKIEKALVLVTSSYLPLTEISNECGFTDQSHFIRTFKQQTGFLPLQYRKYVHC